MPSLEDLSELIRKKAYVKLVEDVKNELKQVRSVLPQGHLGDSSACTVRILTIENGVPTESSLKGWYNDWSNVINQMEKEMIRKRYDGVVNKACSDFLKRVEELGNLIEEVAERVDG